MNLETLTTCPICKGSNLIPINARGGMGSQCIDCGQVFINPRMDDASAREFYAGEYSDRIGRYREGITAEDEERQRYRAEKQLHVMWRHLENVRTMLEIGCSAGYLMDKLNINFDTNCVGVEPDERYHKVAPACTFMLYKDIQDAPPYGYDLIVMSHSLEHMNRPLEFIRNLADNYTYEGSRFMIEVPNYAFIPDTLAAPNHPFAFTKATLEGLMARVGYKPVEVSIHGLMYNAPMYLLGVYGHG
jgi:SAM-dependent methyltransferase